MVGGYDLLHNVFNAILALLWVVFFLLVLKPRHGAVRTIVLFVLVQSISLFICSLIPITWFMFRFVWGMVAIAACAFWLFQDRWTKILLCVGLVFVNIPACEMLAFLMANSAFGQLDAVFSLPFADRVGFYAVYISLYCLLLWFCVLILNRWADQLSGRELLLYIALPFSQSTLVSLNFMVGNRSMIDQLSVLRFATVITCFAADVGIYLAVRGMAQRARLKAVNAYLAEQVESQKEHYSALTTQYETIRMLRHDIASHMHTVRALLENGELEQAARYADELIPRHKFQSNLGECENPIVDAFLFRRIGEAQQKGISVEAHVTLPAETRIANVDLVSAFGNFMDNAEEACMQVAPEQRTIRICASVSDGICNIRMENSTPDDPVHRPRISGLSRGVGMHILNGLAVQYGGSFLTSVKDGCFCSLLTMQA